MTIKAFVHTTQRELKDVLGISLKRSHIYEMIAAAYGYSTYASLQADAILLSNTKWQVALDVSAIEARANILGISIPELAAQKLATSLVQAGIISLRVREILRRRVNDDYITKHGQLPPNSTTASRFSSSDHYAGELMNMFKQNEFNSPLVHQGLVQLSAFADRNALSFPQYELHQKFYKLAGEFNDTDVSGLVDNDRERYALWLQHLKKSAMKFDMEAIELLSTHRLDVSLYMDVLKDYTYHETVAVKCEDAGYMQHAYYWWIRAALQGSINAMHKLISNYEKEDLYRCWIWVLLAECIGYDLLNEVDTSTTYDMYVGSDKNTFTIQGQSFPALTLPALEMVLHHKAQRVVDKLCQEHFDDGIVFEDHGSYD
ncbi:hypothetical protein C3418_21025 [Aeromonas sp. ASNIH8]|uniref:hypothetical protein n=1 Tax=Aeromonas TaxID=642 RepID=UPI000CDDF160|nr:MULTISPECIES: hypothetical protein [Aeromonas]MDK3166421.1 hypothetical protein [Aeromonas caviae]POV85407.1 hypothetical protein C3418_21025 [Aeromonas sp. ASNIH8]